jgi:hypothetical protein
MARKGEGTKAGSDELRLKVQDGGVATRPADQANREQTFSVIHIALTAGDGFTVRTLQPPAPRTSAEVAFGGTPLSAALFINLEMHGPAPSSLLLRTGDRTQSARAGQQLIAKLSVARLSLGSLAPA